MSPFDNKNTETEGSSDNRWRDHVHASATQKLANALAAQQAIRPASNALEFQHNLSQVIERLAQEELALIENMTGFDLLEKLATARAGLGLEFTLEQAQQVGAFEENAIGPDDLDEPDQDKHVGPEGSQP
jgi:hypothetical protein